MAVNTDSQLVAAANVPAGNAPDADQALEVVEVLGDCASGAGSTRAEFAETGQTVIARVAEIHSQEFFPNAAF